MEYRIAKGWKIFAYIFGAAFFIGGFFFFIPVFTRTTFPIGLAISLALLFIVLGAVTFLDTMRTLVIIDKHTLSVARLLGTRSALLEEIEGYRKGEKDTFFIVLKSGGRPLQLPQYLERRKELIGWFEEKYEDVDQRIRAKETEDLLENDQFGLSRDDRAARLATAKTIDRIATGAGIGLFCWAVFYPQPFETMMVTLLAAPAVAIFITWYYKGLMRLEKKKSSPYPSMVMLMTMAIFSALLVIVLRYDLYGFGEHAWSLMLATTLGAVVICITACRKAIAASDKKALTYGVIVVMAGMYSYSLLVFSNCHYDRSVAHPYHVKVTGKRISSGKSTSYYLSLSPWGQYTDGNEVSVSKSFYNQVATHDSVTVFLKKGQWGLPWYFLVPGNAVRINSR